MSEALAAQPEPEEATVIRVRVLGHDAPTALAFCLALTSVIASLSSAQSPIWQIDAVAGSEALAPCDFCLLLPWDEGGAGLDDDQRLQAHRALRHSLLHGQQSFHALRGPQAQQLQQALAALALRDRALKPAGAQTLGRAGWRLACEKCDDPACEHILLGQLLAQRQGAEPKL
ncbi:MAG: hypothetical protein WCK08_02880 [Betaproteobacteria bacterium]